MSSNKPPSKRLSRNLIAALKEGKEGAMLVEPQEHYNGAIIGVYPTPMGGVAVYDYQYLVDTMCQSYKDKSKDLSTKQSGKQLRNTLTSMCYDRCKVCMHVEDRSSFGELARRNWMRWITT